MTPSMSKGRTYSRWIIWLLPPGTVSWFYEGVKSIWQLCVVLCISTFFCESFCRYWYIYIYIYVYTLHLYIYITVVENISQIFSDYIIIKSLCRNSTYLETSWTWWFGLGGFTAQLFGDSPGNHETPRKMKRRNLRIQAPLEKEIHLPNYHFQVLSESSQVYKDP